MLYQSLRFVFIFAGFLFISSNGYSQDDKIPVRDDQPVRPPTAIRHNMHLGFGFGLDYGGVLGVQVGVAPINHLTLFAAGGYYLFEFGWQVGIKGLLIPKTTEKIFRPFLKAMFGTNSVIAVEGADEYDKVYKGFTLGLGVEFRFGTKKANGFDIDLNVPLRTPDFWIDYNTMKNDPRLEVLQGPIPIALSIGFHHEF